MNKTRILFFTRGDGSLMDSVIRQYDPALYLSLAAIT